MAFQKAIKGSLFIHVLYFLIISIYGYLKAFSYKGGVPTTSASVQSIGLQISPVVYIFSFIIISVIWLVVSKYFRGKKGDECGGDENEMQKGKNDLGHL
ncbi:hypothetical protein [Falsibacillus pallidus]|uniref:Uncharacterized protein n=1 Tax=Falsibacillus pallidus TaxID=493781 RepID=A0A370GNX5_9BACI|nr:hypothetical protein [Falsibacillus pallidus]RDI45442.1 hypothetical protein DFR59_10268 [Falsibacillus pallidus]